MKRFLLLFLLVSCARFPERPTSIRELQPQLLSLLPTETEIVSTQSEMLFLFNRPLDPETVHADSILLIQGEIEQDLVSNTTALYQSLEKESLSLISFQIHWEVEGILFRLVPEEPLQEGESYTLVVTPRVLSKDHYPFSQDPTKGELPFFRLYQVLGEDGDSDLGADQKEKPEETTPNEEEAAPSEEGGSVFLNEIYYDIPGADGDGVLFVELFGTPGKNISGYQIIFLNGENGKKVDSIQLPDDARLGEDGFFVIADSRTGSSTTTQVVGADLIDNFDPQNGPDAVQLLDSAGALLDAVGYGEGIVSSSEAGLPLFEGLPSVDVPEGHSLERVEKGSDQDENSLDWVDREIPTPGS